MGLILLVGLIVKNGIILLDFTRLRMRTGEVPLETAVREAARISTPPDPLDDDAVYVVRPPAPGPSAPRRGQ